MKQALRSQEWFGKKGKDGFIYRAWMKNHGISAYEFQQEDFLWSSRNVFGRDPEYEVIWSKLTPMGRAANTNDIANAALFLVSDKAKQITGQSLIIDGGWSAISPSPY